jgi:hypothetical protein
MTIIDPIRLHYFGDSGKWCSLPEWAEYFIHAGKQIASAHRSETRVVMAMVVPTRAFGAAFVSLGMVISNAARSNHPPESAHFEKLFDLPPGTPVTYSLGGKVYKGILKEPKEFNGELCLQVQVQSKADGGLTHLVSASRALQVQPANHPGKLPKKPSGEKVQFSNEFVDCLLGKANSPRHSLESKLILGLVGRKNILEHEVCQTPLAICVKGSYYAEGRLQQVLRVDRFATENYSYLSAFVPIGTQPPSHEVLSKVEVGIVFDGASGFLKWGEMWRGCHQAIILDRTEPYFDDAISSINQRFSQNRTDSEIALPESDAPPGVEVLMFREVIK